MPIATHRSAEHIYSSGDQSALLVQTLEFDKPIDDAKIALLIQEDRGRQESVMIHSRAQLNRLISNLQWVANHVAPMKDDAWEKPDAPKPEPIPTPTWGDPGESLATVWAAISRLEGKLSDQEDSDVKTAMAWLEEAVGKGE